MHTPCNRIPSLCFLFCSLFLLPRIFSFGHALSNTMRLPACKSASACVKRTVLRLDECAMIIQHTIKFNKVCRVALYRQWLTQLYYNGSIFKIYILFNFLFFLKWDKLIPDLFWPVYRVGYWGRCALVTALSRGATQAIHRCMGVVFHNCKQASSLGYCITLDVTLTFLSTGRSRNT